MATQRGRGKSGATGRKSTATKRPSERGADHRKERVLHTRISEQLAADIYRVAEDLRVPVSNLVRNVLEDAFRMAESVTDNVGGLIEDVIDHADRAREKLKKRAERLERDRAAAAAKDAPKPPPAARPSEPASFADMLGWQPFILNRDQPCAQCGVTIARGQRAVVGLTAGGLSQVYVCTPCIEARDPQA